MPAPQAIGVQAENSGTPLLADISGCLGHLKIAREGDNACVPDRSPSRLAEVRAGLDAAQLRRRFRISVSPSRCPVRSTSRCQLHRQSAQGTESTLESSTCPAGEMNELEPRSRLAEVTRRRDRRELDSRPIRERRPPRGPGPHFSRYAFR